MAEVRLPHLRRLVPIALAWITVGAIAFWPVARDGYLYASTLVSLGFLCAFAYSEVAADSASRPDLQRPEAAVPAGWKAWAGVLLGAAVGAGLAMAGLWWLVGRTHPRSGGWFLFYAILFTSFVIATWRFRKYLDVRAAFVTALCMDVVLSAYEHLLLTQDTGWDYHGSEIYSLFHVPVENMLFIYPMASALCSLLIAAARGRWGVIGAFWRLMAALSVVFIVVEFVGIWTFHLWSVDEFASKSVFPFLHTNLEEFVYYFLFQALSMLGYLWLHGNLVPDRARSR